MGFRHAWLQGAALAFSLISVPYFLEVKEIAFHFWNGLFFFQIVLVPLLTC